METNPTNSKAGSRENTDYDTFGSIDSLIFEPKIPTQVTTTFSFVFAPWQKFSAVFFPTCSPFFTLGSYRRSTGGDHAVL